MSNNIITKNNNQTREIEKKYKHHNHFFHLIVLVYMISDKRIKGSIIQTNKKLIIEFINKSGHKLYREEYEN